MRIGKIFLRGLIFILLTLVTQIGGIVYLGSLLTYKVITKKISNNYLRFFLKFSSFLILYFAITFLIVPIIAKRLGRVPLPLTVTNSLQPLNILTCMLNRNYVRPDLMKAAMEVAKQMNAKFPGTKLNYLDANFPFINKFPLLPHLSHNDGKKLDIAFCYIDKKTKLETNSAPSIIGYGISEEPRADEVNTADFCSKNGYWQYNLLMKIIPQGNKVNFTFDSVRTKQIVNFFASNPLIGKIFIEPHLKYRLNVTSGKIRFQGCHAIRHDDHIHIQLN